MTLTLSSVVKVNSIESLLKRTYHVMKLRIMSADIEEIPPYYIELVLYRFHLFVDLKERKVGVPGIQ